MERGIREEDVTKKLLKWLIDTGWEIISFDFPQSGTGYQLHPNNSTSKTEGVIIPDIVAYKNNIVLDFENKDRFVLRDVEKISSLRQTDNYSQDWDRLLKDKPFNHIYYGIGLPYTSHNEKRVNGILNMVDFVVFITENDKFKVIDNVGDLF